MGLLERPPAQDELQCLERPSEAAPAGRVTATAGLEADGNPLSAARGTVIGVTLGGAMWAAILWALL